MSSKPAHTHTHILNKQPGHIRPFLEHYNKHIPTSGFPMETMVKEIPFTKSSLLTFLYLRSCSWHRGHPNDRKNTTTDVGFIKFLIDTGLPVAK
mmetsp:Transcript_21222/g.32465  ORF Transcript_21222/g.32465 Transcript_21222/m.32465 type:complete len:94 (-) Transcript_21222:318-599(-)